MKNLIAVFGTLIGCCLIGQVRSQGKKESILPITLENKASCQEILAASTFEGTCCSLSSTPAGGCLLSVIAGNCVIKGDIWVLDFTSTDDINSCRESDFPITPSPTASPGGEGDEQDSTGDGSSSAGVVASSRMIVATLAMPAIWSLCA